MTVPKYVKAQGGVLAQDPWHLTKFTSFDPGVTDGHKVSRVYPRTQPGKVDHQAVF